MPNVHIRKELYEKLESHGVDPTEKVNEILQTYIKASTSPSEKYYAEDLHLKAYHEHGNAD